MAAKGGSDGDGNGSGDAPLDESAGEEEGRVGMAEGAAADAESAVGSAARAAGRVLSTAESLASVGGSERLALLAIALAISATRVGELSVDCPRITRFTGRRDDEDAADESAELWPLLIASARSSDSSACSSRPSMIRRCDSIGGWPG